MSSVFSRLEIKKYAVAFALAFAITAALLAILSVIFAFLPPPLWLLTLIHNYCSYFSAFLAAFLCGRKSKGRGFLTGIVTATVYMAVLLALGGLFFKTMVSFPVLIKALVPCALCGAVGGILGINCK